MSIVCGTKLRERLRQQGLRPRKELSQNFLVDGNIQRKILAAARLSENDLVLEIGPGAGALTEGLLSTGAQVLAVEKDRQLAEQLPDHPRLRLFIDDIRRFPLEEQLKAHLKEGQKAIVVGNLPYHLTTPILTRLLPLHSLIDRCLCMVQEEYAQRVVAPLGTRGCSSLSVFCQFYSRPRYCFSVSHHCFYPPPKVDSAILEMTLHEAPSDIHAQEFEALVRKAFQQRRKTLRKSLKGVLDEAVFSRASVEAQHRPEELTLEQWMRLAREKARNLCP